MEIEPKMSLSDRMNYYERMYDLTFNCNNVYLIRLDGNGFSKRIKKWKLSLPFDNDFHWAMVDTCKELIGLIPNARLIYTCSDEITIVCVLENTKNTWFANRINKVVSLSSSYATAYFNKFMKESGINVDKFPAFFDSRVVTLPNFEEAVNNILCRYNDCKRNSVSMLASTVYSHKALLNKNTQEKLTMLEDKGIHWDNSDEVYNWSKYGTLIYKESICYDIKTNTEQARHNKALELFEQNPDLYYVRNKALSKDLTKNVDMFKTIEALLF